MKTLVIHPQDPTTDFLQEVYRDKNYKVIRNTIPKRMLKEFIKEADRVVLMGHGGPKGLYAGTGYNRYQLIDSTYLYLLRKVKDLVCVWCNADQFVEKHKLNALYTGMIISEYDEALDNAVSANAHELEQSNYFFAFALRKAVEMPSGKVYESMADEVMKAHYVVCTPYSAVVEFNAARIFQTNGDQLIRFEVIDHPELTEEVLAVALKEPKQVPLLQDFDNERVLGMTFLSYNDKKIDAAVDFVEPIKRGGVIAMTSDCQLAVAGYTQRDNFGKILSFELHSCSLVLKGAEFISPPLAEEANI